MKKTIIVALLIFILTFSLASAGVKFSFAVISDTHNENKCDVVQGKWLGEAVNIINSRNPAFVIGNGDLISGGTTDCSDKSKDLDDQLNKLKEELLNKLTVPFFPVAGNHDLFADGSRNIWNNFWLANKNALLTNVVGYPQSYRFTYQGVGFSLIDYYGTYGLKQAELDWINQQVQPGDLVFRHVGPYTTSGTVYAIRDYGEVSDVTQLTTLLKNKNINTLFSGHTHAFYDGVCGGLHYVNTGSLGGRSMESTIGIPSQYRGKQSFVWVDVMDDNSLNINFYVWDGSKMVLFDKSNFPTTVQSLKKSEEGQSYLAGVPSICTSVKTSTYVDGKVSSSNNNNDVIQKGSPGVQAGTPGTASSSSGTQDPNQQYTKVPRNLPKSQEEIDEVWYLKLGNIIRNSNLIWNPDTKLWEDFIDTYYQFVAVPTSAGPISTGNQPTQTGSQQTSSGSYSSKGACFKYILSATESEAHSKLVSVEFQGRKIDVNKIIAPLFKKVNAEINALNTGYNIYSSGTFNWRCVKPRVDWDEPDCIDNNGQVHRSRHSYGGAIDINPNENPYCYVNEITKELCDDSSRTKCGTNAVKCKGKGYNLPDSIAQVFKNNDFDWGGDWLTVKDYMHFEWDGNIGDFNGDGVLEQCPQQATVTSNSHAQCQSIHPGWACQCASGFVNGIWTKEKCDADPNCATGLCFGAVNEQYCCSNEAAGKPSTPSSPSGTLQQVSTGNVAVKFQTYTTSCLSNKPDQTGRIEGIIIPESATTNPEIYFYFHGNTGDTENNPDFVLDYATSKNMLNNMEGKNAILVILKGASPNSCGETETRNGELCAGWAKKWFEGSNKFSCFYNEAIQKISELGYSPTSMSFMGHSQGGKAINNIINGGFLNTFHLPLSSVNYYDACYGSYCSGVMSQIIDQGAKINFIWTKNGASVDNKKVDVTAMTGISADQWQEQVSYSSVIPGYQNKVNGVLVQDLHGSVPNKYFAWGIQ